MKVQSVRVRFCRRSLWGLLVLAAFGWLNAETILHHNVTPVLANVTVQHVTEEPLPAFNSTRRLDRVDRGAASINQCPNYITNGGFEEERDWWTDPGDNFQYDTRYAFSGSRSFSMNSFDGRSVGFWQRVTIPATTSELTLDFESRIVTGAVDQNVYVRIYDTHFDNLLQAFSLRYGCDCEWEHFSPTLDRALLAGRTVNLAFEIEANGAIDEVNFDEVQLGVCQSGPTATPLPKPLLLAPLGTIHSDTPTFSWQALPGAVRYLLWVNEYGNPNVPGKVNQDYTPDQAGCATGTTCTVSPGVRFTAEAQWWITAYFNSGFIASESDTGAFSINLNVTSTPSATLTSTATPAPPHTRTAVPPTATPSATGLPPNSTATPTTTPTGTVMPTATTTSTTATVTATVPPPPANGDAYENDDNCTMAKPLTTDGLPQQHSFHAQADQDWLRFPVTANTAYIIEGDVPNDSVADLLLGIYDQCSSGALETQDYSYSPDVRLTFTATQSTDYYIRLVNSKADRYGDDVTYQIAVREVAPAATVGALIIVAGRLQEEDALQAQIHKVTDRVYRLWRNQGYPADRIRYLATDLNRDPDSDGKADVHAMPDNANLRQAITEWATGSLQPGQPLTLYLMDHGGYDKFYLDEPRRERLSPQDLDQWLTTLETAVPGVRVTVIIEACNAGSFIDPDKSISRAGRVVIASSGAYELAWATNSGAFFSDALLDGLAMGKTLLGAFYEAQANTRRSPSAQTPWLDDDGDQVPNSGDDGLEAAKVSFRAAGAFDRSAYLWQPYVVQGEARASDNLVTAGADNRREIWAEVRDDGKVESVWAVIYPPGYQPPTDSEALVNGPPPITLQARGNNQYAGLYGAFDAVGNYRIVIYALDDDDLHSPAKEFFFANGSQIFLPTVMR